MIQTHIITSHKSLFFPATSWLLLLCCIVVVFSLPVDGRFFVTVPLFFFLLIACCHFCLCHCCFLWLLMVDYCHFCHCSSCFLITTGWWLQLLLPLVACCHFLPPVDCYWFVTAGWMLLLLPMLQFFCHQLIVIVFVADGWLLPLCLAPSLEQWRCPSPCIWMHRVASGCKGLWRQHAAHRLIVF